MIIFSQTITHPFYLKQFASAKAKEIAAKNIGSKSSLVDISSTLNMALGADGNGMKDERSDMAGTLMTIFRRYKSRSNNKKSSNFRDVERVLGSVEVRYTFHVLLTLRICFILPFF